MHNLHHRWRLAGGNELLRRLGERTRDVLAEPKYHSDDQLRCAMPMYTTARYMRECLFAPGPIQTVQDPDRS